MADVEYRIAKNNTTKETASKSNYLDKIILKSDESQRWKNLADKIEVSKEDTFETYVKKQKVLIKDDIKRKAYRLKSFSKNLVRWLNHDDITKYKDVATGENIGKGKTFKDENTDEYNDTTIDEQSKNINNIPDETQIDNKLEKKDLEKYTKSEKLKETTSEKLSKKNKGLEFLPIESPKNSDSGISNEINIKPSMLKAIPQFRASIIKNLNIKGNDTYTNRLVSISLYYLRNKLSSKSDSNVDIAKIYEECVDEAIKSIESNKDTKQILNNNTTITINDKLNTTINEEESENIDDSQSLIYSTTITTNDDETDTEESTAHPEKATIENQNSQQNGIQITNDAFEYRYQILKKDGSSIPPISKKYSKFKFFKNKELKNLINNMEKINNSKGRLLESKDFENARKILKSTMNDDYENAQNEGETTSDFSKEKENSTIIYKNKIKSNYPYFENLIRNYDFIDSEEDAIRQALNSIYSLYKIDSANENKGKFDDDKELDIGTHKKILETDANIINDLSKYLRNDEDYNEEYDHIQDLIKIKELTQDDNEYNSHWNRHKNSKRKPYYATLQQLRTAGVYGLLLKKLPIKDIDKILSKIIDFSKINHNSLTEGNTKTTLEELKIILKNIAIKLPSDYSGIKLEIEDLTPLKISKLYKKNINDFRTSNINYEFFKNTISKLNEMNTNKDITFDPNKPETKYLDF